MRTGIGYDVHRLSENRKLILGGEEIPFDKGLDGHSDADVLIHAIMDALLGAAGLGDIGWHFPDNDDKYKDASSLKLLKQVAGIINGSGYNIVNIDSVIIAQNPKLSTYIKNMEKNICTALGLDQNKRLVNIKATTEEWLGFTGRGEGIAAQAICLLE